MALRPATAYSTRPISLLVLVGLAAAAVWMFAPGGASFGAGGQGSDVAEPSLAVSGDVQVTADGDVVRRLVVPVRVSGGDGVGQKQMSDPG